MFKPFKAPQPRAVPPVEIDLTRIPDSETDTDEEPARPYKKRKLLIHDVIPDSPPKKVIASAAVNAPRKPLLVKTNNVVKEDKAEKGGYEGFYHVVWRKFQAKKHKTWDGDGVLAVRGGYATLQNIEDGREMGRTTFNDALLPGSTLSVGGKDMEVTEMISRADYMAGLPFLNGGAIKSSNLDTKVSIPKKVAQLPKGKLPPSGKKSKDDDDTEEISAANFYSSAPKKTAAIGNQFKNPLKTSTVIPQNAGKGMTPRHDPFAAGALVMKRPEPLDIPKGKKVVDVVVDPFIGKHLRDHQRDGVQFLYECVMNLRGAGGSGALLADEMGLGKTLQTIALIWTLLKQNPFYSPGNENVIHKGAIKKAVIVCPVTLISNWKKEFRKWLGNERCGVLVVDEKTKMSDFTQRSTYQVMIIGYEKLRSVAGDLKKGEGVDLVVADEGHRLKTAKNKAAEAIRSLNCERRIILSGTPLQNDLSEFFIMVDFINPGVLGSSKKFKKEFEAPILKSREQDATKNEEELGMARQKTLSELTSLFILRRTSEVMAKYLPAKTDYVVFCKPTQVQAQVYESILASPYYSKVLGQNGPEASFQLITLLKKVCNAPSLLAGKDDSPPTNPVVVDLLESIPAELLRMSPVKASSKFRMLDSLIRHLSKNTTEKIVIVSNYTATLDIIQQHLASLSLKFLRLDGKTPAATRQGLVDNFNRTDASQNFAFLLSAKSGGAGINLIGASRLVLYDIDWNPAVDLQAMARIHRDGQTKPVKIYRFLMAGALDEKIFQRQVTKMGLADEIVDGKKSDSSFSAAELKALFRLETANCQTHDLIGCDCEGCGRKPPDKEALQALQDDDAAAQDASSSDVSAENSSIDDEVLARPRHRMVPATVANVAAAQKVANLDTRRKKKDGGKMQYLLRYRHIDTSVFQSSTLDAFDQEKDEVKDIKDALDDKVLVGAITEGQCKVNFVFAKKG